MNDDVSLKDCDLTAELRTALSQLATPERPPLAAITGQGRAYRRRRRAGVAGLGVTGFALVTALALGLTVAFGPNPAGRPGTSDAAPPAHRAGAGDGTIRTAAFILTSNSNGTDTLSLTMSQMLDPAALQQALAAHGIPALVKTGTYCTSNPPAPDPLSTGVLKPKPPAGGLLPHGPVPSPSGPPPDSLPQLAARSVTVINPAAIPAGTELFFGYSSTDHAVFTGLIDVNSYTCSSSVPPPAPSTGPGPAT